MRFFRMKFGHSYDSGQPDVLIIYQRWFSRRTRVREGRVLEESGSFARAGGEIAPGLKLSSYLR
jgi:hypothetical protein